jgi:hypothetical protein
MRYEFVRVADEAAFTSVWCEIGDDGASVEVELGPAEITSYGLNEKLREALDESVEAAAKQHQGPAKKRKPHPDDLRDGTAHMVDPVPVIAGTKPSELANTTLVGGYNQDWRWDYVRAVTESWSQRDVTVYCFGCVVDVNADQQMVDFVRANVVVITRPDAPLSDEQIKLLMRAPCESDEHEIQTMRDDSLAICGSDYVEKRCSRMAVSALAVEKTSLTSWSWTTSTKTVEGVIESSALKGSTTTFANEDGPKASKSSARTVIEPRLVVVDVHTIQRSEGVIVVMDNRPKIDRAVADLQAPPALYQIVAPLDLLQRVAAV